MKITSVIATIWNHVYLIVAPMMVISLFDYHPMLWLDKTLVVLHIIWWTVVLIWAVAFHLAVAPWRLL